jgi:predicted metal-dependent enzyme (double-stranded beta helix superfamily)
MTHPRPDLTGVDAPLRALFEVVAEAGRPGDPDMAAIGRAMVELARDHDHLMPRVAELGDTTGILRLLVPERGPRLMLVHRREGEISAVHDHGCWVAIAPIVGVETHRLYRAIGSGEQARLERISEQALAHGDSATIVPPHDLHDHGHLVGHGDAAYVLIMTGDDQSRYVRQEWDLATGRHTVLDVGVRGRFLANEPFVAY